MWHTSKGDRALAGVEAQLFKIGARFLVDYIRGCDHVGEKSLAGVDAFDRLNNHQKIAMIRNVAEALLAPKRPPPELNALNEATVHAIYQNLLTWVEGASCGGGRSSLRTLVLEVARLSDDGEMDYTSPSCVGADEWPLLMDMCEDRILWDRDFDIEADIIDAPPENSRQRKELLDIADDYFTAVAPDPTADEHRVNIKRLEKLLSASAASGHRD